MKCETRITNTIIIMYEKAENMRTCISIIKLQSGYYNSRDYTYDV